MDEKYYSLSNNCEYILFKWVKFLGFLIEMRYIKNKKYLPYVSRILKFPYL